MTSEQPRKERCGAKCSSGGYCENYPVSGSERCRMHGGTTPTKDENPNVGKGSENQEGNQRATTHALNADPKNYKENQDPEDEDWIRCTRESILDRIRKSGTEPDFLDKVLAERVAIQLHIAANASEYVDSEGLVQTVFVEDGGYEKDIPNSLVKELRQFDKDIISNLKKLGVLDDPDSQTAESLEDVGKALMENLAENH